MAGGHGRQVFCTVCGRCEGCKGDACRDCDHCDGCKRDEPDGIAGRLECETCGYPCYGA
jgi:hypothetical protein